MNAEIVARLQQSFDIPDQTVDIVSQIEAAINSADPSSSLEEIQSQIRAILSHLGLPDPAEEVKARREEERKAARDEWEAAQRPDAGPPTIVSIGPRADKPEDESK
jgi:ABC-type hemin transport system substrate-binding protein